MMQTSQIVSTPCFCTPINIKTHAHHNKFRASSSQSHQLVTRIPPSRSQMSARNDTKPTGNAELPPGVTRTSIPLLFPDVVTISDPDLIRKISSRSDVGRQASAKLPFLFKQFFVATKFYYPRNDEWSGSMLTDGATGQQERRENTIHSLSSGFTDEQVDRIEALIKSNDDMPTLGIKCAKLIAEVILPLPEGEELPDDIARACFDTLEEVFEAANLFNYFKGRRARAKVENYVLKINPNEKHPSDIVHNLGAASQGFSKAIYLLQGRITDDVVPILSKDPVITNVARVPLTKTTLDAIFPEDNPLIPDKTMIVLDLQTAVAKTEDDKFLFGTGTERRQCPFKKHFLSVTDTIRNRNISG